MLRKIVSLTSILVAAASLGGCSPLIDAQVEEPEVCLSQGFNIPGVNFPPLANIDMTVNGADSFSVPELPTQSGDVKLTEKLNLTRAYLLAAPGVNLGFIKAVHVSLSSMTQPLMSFQTSSPTNVTSVDLNVSRDDLVSALSGGRDIQYTYSVTGQIPQQSTSARIKICLYAKAEVGVH